MKPLKLAVSILLPLIAGFAGSFFTSSAWYQALDKPFFSPPSWVFGPVWTSLYILMGISFYLIWTSGRSIGVPSAVFLVQLGLNAVWSPLFFGLRNPLLAFIDLALLWIAIIATIILFYRIDRRAAYLLIPYILWVSFAGLLNWWFV